MRRRQHPVHEELIAFLAYLANLHGRLDKLIGLFGVAALFLLSALVTHRSRARLQH